MQLNVLDYAIIAVLLLSGLAGLRRGLFNVIGGLMGIMIGLLAAIIFHRELALSLEGYFGLSTWLAGVFQEKLPLPALNPGLVKALDLPAGLADPALYLSTSLVIAISFLLILLLGSKLVQLLCRLLETVFARGILSGVNRGLGMGLLVLKNLLIMVVLAGVLLPHSLPLPYHSRPYSGLLFLRHLNLLCPVLLPARLHYGYQTRPG
jgi:uncharacterized membrane protein required for colicin V production